MAMHEKLFAVIAPELVRAPAASLSGNFTEFHEGGSWDDSEDCCGPSLVPMRAEITDRQAARIETAAARWFGAMVRGDRAAAREDEARLHAILKAGHLGEAFNLMGGFVFWVDRRTPAGRVNRFETCNL